MTIVSDLAPWPVEAPAPSFAELSIGFLCLSGLGGSSRVAFGVANAVVAGDGASVVLNGHRRWRLDPRVAHVEIATPEFPKALDSLEVSALGRALAQHVQCHDIRVLAVHYGLGLADVALDAVTRLDRIGIRLPVVVTLHGSEVSHVGCDPAHRLAVVAKEVVLGQSAERRLAAER